MTTGNTQIKNLNFGEALAHLKNGYCVANDWLGCFRTTTRVR